MSDPFDSKLIDDPAFQSVLVSCLEALQRGEAIDGEQLASDHPDYAEAIQQFLDDQTLLEQATLQFMPNRLPRSNSDNVRTIVNDSTMPMLSAGDTVRYIGEYEILGEIARGGMGVVFKAKQGTLNRIVALKMILVGRLASEADVERFRREARAAGRLKHPNIVPIHEVDKYEGHHYFTMDLVEGRSLAELVREETLAPRYAAEIVAKVARAVEYAHKNGTLHRDLKPANILIDIDGEPHITDFGLAKLIEADDDDRHEDLTASGQVLGTPSYMSPEQASGKTALLGPASDIYSLGAILYSCIAGRAPFIAESTVNTLMQVIKQEPVAPRALNPSVPKDLETICLKCLAKEPHKRYGTAQQLADDLEQYIEGKPVAARPINRLEKTWRWGKRNPLVASLAVASVLLLVGGTAVSTFFAVEADKRADAEAIERQRADDQAEVAQQALAKERIARADAELARDQEARARQLTEQALQGEAVARRQADYATRTAQWQTYVARLQSVRQASIDKEWGQLDRLLQEMVPASGAPDFRGWEWHYLYDLCRQRTSPIGKATTLNRHFDWHPKTKRLAAFDGNKLQLWTGDPPTLQTQIAIHPPGVVRFAPDGTKLAVVHNLGVKIFAVASGNVITTFKLTKQDGDRASNRVTAMQWRPDGSVIATGTEMGAIHLWNPDTGALARSITSMPNNFPCNELHWHPTEPLLAVGTRYGRVFTIDTEEDRPLWVGRIDRDYVFTVRWNPSGTMLAGATNGTSDGARLVVWNHDGQQRMRSANRAITGTPSIDWFDNQRLVVGTSDHDIHCFHIDKEAPTKTIRMHDGPVERVRHYGDGQRVISSSRRTIRVSRVDDDMRTATATPVHKFGIKAISWSSDSRRVATSSWDGMVAITDVRDGQVVHELDGHANGAVNDVAWSRDALRVASCDHSGEYRIWDPDAGEIISSFHGGAGSAGFNSVSWIDDDLVVAGAETISIFDVDKGEAVTLIDHSMPHFANLSYCPTNQLIGHLGSGRLAIYGLDGTSIFVSHLPANRGLAWSPDGKILLAGGDSGIQVVDAQSFKTLPVMRGHAGAVTDVCFSPDGSRIASSGRDGTVRIWDRATGAELFTLRHADVQSFTCLGWSPDGSTIAAAATGLVVAWHTRTGSDAPIPSSLSTGADASVSPDEELVLLSQATRSIPHDASVCRERLSGTRSASSRRRSKMTWRGTARCNRLTVGCESKRSQPRRWPAKRKPIAATCRWLSILCSKKMYHLQPLHGAYLSQVAPLQTEAGRRAARARQRFFNLSPSNWRCTNAKPYERTILYGEYNPSQRVVLSFPWLLLHCHKPDSTA